MESIAFFVDDIAIRADEATDRRHLARPVTVREFAGRDRVRMLDCGGGRLRLEAGAAGSPGFRFIEGPEAV
jgi:hypothetical protein